MQFAQYYYFAFTYRFFFMEERLRGESLCASAGDDVKT